MYKILVTLWIALSLLFMPALALAGVTCPLHNYASCYDTGQIAPNGGTAHKWHCSCGDDVWVN
jgi:hypothetical protein